MAPAINRRDFLKLASYIPLGLYASTALKFFNLQKTTDQQNIILVTFDALSAHNMSLYGYARETTPNINKLAERAIVYHNHIAGSNFTTSGTASILTGALPWTHRALQPNGQVVNNYVDKSIFSVFNDYYRLAYSHNEWVNTLFDQFKNEIEEWIPRDQLYLFSSDSVVQGLFQGDKDISSVAWARNIKIMDEGYAYSLFLSRLFSFFERRQVSEYVSQFPRGLPTAHADNGFLLEHAVDELLTRVDSISRPLFAYFHFLPPHDPYRPPIDYWEVFRRDKYSPLEKKLDVFATEHSDNARSTREFYDEFILYVDREFGRLVEGLEASGKLENTWLILTSDHGESFERGIIGHSTEALYQPLIHVPLVIFEPGRTSRQDVHTQTSVVDLMPTLAHLAGKSIPAWAEGKLLPPYAEAVPDHSIYSVRSYSAEKNAPLRRASVALLKGRYKLHYYFGYPEINLGELIKLYDLETDPEEITDLAPDQPEVVAVLLNELKASLSKSDQPYL